jgi:hypothetical protein
MSALMFSSSNTKWGVISLADVHVSGIEAGNLGTVYAWSDTMSTAGPLMSTTWATLGYDVKHGYYVGTLKGSPMVIWTAKPEPNPPPVPPPPPAPQPVIMYVEPDPEEEWGPWGVDWGY